MPALHGDGGAQDLYSGLVMTPQAMRGGAPLPVPPAAA
jgi:hypothetical protein